MRAMVLAGLFLGVMAAGNLGAMDGDGSESMLLVRDGAGAVPVIVAADAPAANLDAARDLALYIEKISGAPPELIVGRPADDPASAVWVGIPDNAARLFPGADLEFRHPEEILILCNGRHLLIAGRDRIVDGSQTEYGTPNAVYTFLQEYLDVRWLWPGELGTDIIERATIGLAPFEYRYHPQIRQRVFYYPRNNIAHADEVNRWMDVYQRCRGSLTTDSSHSFGDWSRRYFADHPEYFGMQPDGTRRGGPRAKLCVSNPDVAAQWLENATRMLRDNPEQELIGISPNDGGGWCFCEDCLAWDHPEGGVNHHGHNSMTERYVKFWNILARGIRERFPDRNIRLDTMAYSRYSLPPVEETLEDNIGVAYVGHFPITDSERRALQHGYLRQWAAKCSMLRYRPNAFRNSGGHIGLPVIATQNTIEDFRLLAENGVIGFALDFILFNFATKGPQNYLMTQLLYDPMRDGHALLEDYYRRGFGEAARDVADYFQLLEEVHQVMLDENISWTDTYTPELLARAAALLDQADRSVTDAPERYRRRVAFLRTGLDFTALQMDIMRTMALVIRSQGRDREAVERAVELCAARDRMFKTAEPFALDNVRIVSQTRRRLGGRLGPPTKAHLQAGAAGAEAKPEILLEPAQWQLAFEDRFERDEPGADWEAVDGVWVIEDGRLTSYSVGASVITTRSFPGLQRIEIVASAPLPELAGGDVSDLSPYIQAGREGAHRAGYFLQFGAGFNKRNVLSRMGEAVRRNTEHAIKAGEPHLIVAELDGRHVRLTVDGEIVLEYAEPAPLFGPQHDRWGFYTWTGARIDSVRVYTAEARVQTALEPGDPDLDE